MQLPSDDHDDAGWDESPEPMTHESTEVKSKSKKTKSKKTKSKKTKSKSASPTASPDFELPGPSYKVIWIPPDDIKVDLTSRCRPVMPRVVESFVDSIPKDGLRTPITISLLNGVAHLAAGLQRLEALKILGWSEVPCVCENDELAAQRWQINENLCRGELTKLQRAKQTVALLALSDTAEEISGEKVQKNKRGRPEGGDAKAARSLPVRGKTPDAKRKNIGEDRKITDIHEDAQQALVDAGLDDDGKALRAVADEPTREAQVAKVKDLAKGSRNTDPGSPGEHADDAEPPLVVLKREWKKAKKWRAAWETAQPDDRRAFIIEDLKYPLGEEPEDEDDEDDDYDEGEYGDGGHGDGEYDD
jgi:ParB-like chromosome segregation protein Spo0J